MEKKIKITFQLKPVLKDEESRETTMEDVYDEFNNYAGRNGIKEFRSMKVTKNYSFEREGTPKTAEYMEVRYLASYPQLDASYSGRAIEAVFGTSVNALEYLLIDLLEEPRSLSFFDSEKKLK